MFSVPLSQVGKHVGKSPSLNDLVKYVAWEMRRKMKTINGVDGEARRREKGGAENTSSKGDGRNIEQSLEGMVREMRWGDCALGGTQERGRIR
jgi:hypothetical protein